MRRERPLILRNSAVFAQFNLKNLTFFGSTSSRGLSSLWARTSAIWKIKRMNLVNGWQFTTGVCKLFPGFSFCNALLVIYSDLREREHCETRDPKDFTPQFTFQVPRLEKCRTEHVEKNISNEKWLTFSFSSPFKQRFFFARGAPFSPSIFAWKHDLNKNDQPKKT